MKHFLLSLLTLTTLSAHAGPVKTLFKNLKDGTPFQLQGQNKACPDYVVLEKSKYRSDWAKKDDIEIRLSGSKLENGKMVFDTFTHENNTIFYRPGLEKNKSHKLNGEAHFILGAAFNSAFQEETEQAFISSSYAKIFTIVMIAIVHSSITAEADGTLKYHFEGNGVDDVDCEYRPDPQLKKYFQE